MGGFYHGGYGMMGGWSLLGMLPGLLISIGIIVIIIMAIRYLAKGIGQYGHGGHGFGGVSSDSESAEEILKKRYARGEISKEEFEKIREDIK